MRKITKYRFDYLGYDTNMLKLIGRGHEGKVYLLPNDKVLKVFHNPNSCARQVKILLKAQNSRFFPTVFGYDKYSIIMSFVYGSPLSIYLKQNNISKHLIFFTVKCLAGFKHF
jgi:predicted Ser/Thr protein kinase